MGQIPTVVSAPTGEVALFATHRVNAWHGLAQPFTRVITSTAEMVREANLDKITFRSEPREYPQGVNVLTPMHDLIMDNGLDGSTTYVGTGTERYEVRQIPQVMDWINLDSAGMRWETAGLMGAVLFATVAVDHKITIDPNGVNDVVENYIMVTTSWDQSLANIVGYTPVRVVCRNTLTAALGSLSGGFKFKSTRNVEQRAQDWKAAQRNALDDMKAFEAEAQALFATPVSDTTFTDKILPAIKPRPEKDVKGAQSKWDRWMERNVEAWKGAPNAGIRGTAWGAVNALTEADQWKPVTRRDDNASARFWAKGAGFDSATNAFRRQAVNVVKAFA